MSPSRRINAFGIVAFLALVLYLVSCFQGANREDRAPVHNNAAPAHVLKDTQSGCNEHHIVFVLGRYKSISLASTLFKSILYHHQGPLVFHLITDEQSRQVLATLFETWKLPSVRYHVYDMEKYKKEVDWIHDTHYSSFYPLIKMIIPDILSDDVKEVLMLDSDTLVLHDITPLLDSLKDTNESVLFAMGENISPWYEKKKLWTYRGRGFNAGIVMLHLERMRKANWSTIWKPITKRIMDSYKEATDQDILNALIVTQPELFVEFPCEYNFQLGVNAQPLTCQKEDIAVKIAHFNSDVKLNLKNKFVVHFAHLYFVYQSMDGYVFRQRERCDADKSSSTLLTDLTETDIECGELLAAIQTTYRTHLYFNGIMAPSATGDISLITHLSVDRLDIFKILLDSWDGPVSAAVYCTDAELTQIEKFMKASNIARGRNNVALHAVFKTGNYYPINYLRNVAMNASNTEFAYLTNIDFIPSKGLYQTLRSTVMRDMENTALVIPSFEMSPSVKVQYPNTKEELINQWDEGKFLPAGNMFNATNYDKWKDAESPFEIKWTFGEESFAVLTRHNESLYEAVCIRINKGLEQTPVDALLILTQTASYDDRFVGHGWGNMVQHSSLLSNEFHFEMIPSAYTVHHSHSPSFDMSRLSELALYKKCMRSLKNQFARDTNFQTLVQQEIAVHLT